MRSPLSTLLAVLDPQADGVRHLVELHLAVLAGDGHAAQGGTMGLVDLDGAGRSQRSSAIFLGFLASNSSSTRGRPWVISSPCNAAGVERTHGQLCARLADGLGRNDTDGFAQY